MSYWSGGYGGWAPRKSVAARRADAARQIKDAARQGRAMAPVVVAGRKIATTFWGKAWCDNLERYRDFAYRLERGRSYLRSGSVIDLKISAGKVVATVAGSSLYSIEITIDEIKHDAWHAIQRDCAGGVGSRLDLLSGRLSEPVMTRLCADQKGMFPAPASIRFTCSCPDYAAMCKHVAAVMYGIGARLDQTPELLFTLRRVSLDELLASAVSALPATPSATRVLADHGLAALFGIELAEAAAPQTSQRRGRAGAVAGPAITAGVPPARPGRPGHTAASQAPRGPTARKALTRPGPRDGTRPAPSLQNRRRPSTGAATFPPSATSPSPTKPAPAAKTRTPAKAPAPAKPPTAASPAPAKSRPAATSPSRTKSASAKTSPTPTKPAPAAKPPTPTKLASAAKTPTPTKPAPAAKPPTPTKPALAKSRSAATSPVLVK